MPDKKSLEGLYYYHVFARALHARGEPFIVDGKGQRHRWCDDACQALLKRRHGDGGWVNTADRWYEANPDPVTAYSVPARPTALRPNGESGTR